MAEQQLYSYWDEGATSGNQATMSQQQSQSYLHQHRQQQKQQISSPSQAAPQQPHNLMNLNFCFDVESGQENSTQDDLQVLASAPFGGFSTPLNQLYLSSSTSGTEDTAPVAWRDGQSTQQAVLQLQQNYLLMLQQQNEQIVNATGATAMGESLNLNPMSGASDHAPKDIKGWDGSGSASRNQKDTGFLQSVFDSEEDSNFIAQYRQLFGLPLEGPVTVAPTTSNPPNSNSTDFSNSSSTTGNYDRTKDNVSPDSSRLFALGAMVQPLSSYKPEQVGSSSGGNKKPRISAAARGMSESSSDLLLNLFQPNASTQFQPGNETRQYQKQQQLSPTTVPSNPVISGSETEQLKGLQSSQEEKQPHQTEFEQRQQNQMQSIGSSFSRDEQQRLQEELLLKQRQLQQLQEQISSQTPLQVSSHDFDPWPLTTPEHSFDLPCTMLPPSVLASMFSVETHTRKPKATPVKAGKSHVKARKFRFNVSPSLDAEGEDKTEIEPHKLLCEILDRRGYDKGCRVKADIPGYDAVPSPLQLASFGMQLVKAVQTSNTELLSKLLECGLSPNPCNQFRDSVFFDLVIKRSNLEIFECFLQHGCDLQVVDGFGRTPLHHCCWASHFCRPIVESILERDPVQMFLEDKHGQTPLEYVRANLYGEWNEFLEEVADKYWPVGGQLPYIVSPKDRRPNGHLVDPPNALPVTLASMLSSGAVSVEQILNMDENTRRTYQK